METQTRRALHIVNSSPKTGRHRSRTRRRALCGKVVSHVRRRRPGCRAPRRVTRRVVDEVACPPTRPRNDHAVPGFSIGCGHARERVTAAQRVTTTGASRSRWRHLPVLEPHDHGVARRRHHNDAHFAHLAQQQSRPNREQRRYDEHPEDSGISSTSPKPWTGICACRLRACGPHLIGKQPSE